MKKETTKGRSRKRKTNPFLQNLLYTCRREYRRALSVGLTVAMMCNSTGMGMLTSYADTEDDDTFWISYMVDPLGGAEIIGKEEVKAGDDLVFTIVPEDGYEIEEVLINGEDYEDYYAEYVENEIATASNATASNATASNAVATASNATPSDADYADGMTCYLFDIDDNVDVEIKMIGQGGTYTQELDSAVITAEVPEGAFLENVELVAREVESGTAEYEDIRTMLADNGFETVFFTAYDVKFVNADDQEVEPMEAVTVTIESPGVMVLDAMDTATEDKIVHIHDDVVTELSDAEITIDEETQNEVVMVSVDQFSYLVRATSTVAENTLTVDASAAEEVAGVVYQNIQNAIDYIVGLENSEGWTINVKAGEYERFTVPHWNKSGIADLSIIGESEESVIVNVLNEAYTTDALIDNGGINIYGKGVTLANMTIKAGTVKQAWDDAAISTNHGMNGGKDIYLSVKNCTLIGPGIGNGATYAVFWACSGVEVNNCEISGFANAIEYMNDGYNIPAGETYKFTNNTITGASFAIHGYMGGGNGGGTLLIANNTVTGTKDLRSKVIAQDNTTNSFVVDIKNNEFENVVVGLVNLQDDGDIISDVFANNTLGDGCFYVEAIEPGTIEFYTTFQAPEENEGYWALTGLEDFDVDWGKNPDGSTAYIKEIIAKANEAGSHTLSITGIDENNLIKTFTWFKDGIYWVSDPTPELPDVEIPDGVDWERSKSKEATNLDEKYESDVTLSLPSASYKGNLDVAFVFDGSTSTDEDDLASAAAGLLEELAGMENLNVKASLTVLGGSVPVLETTELLSISDEANLQLLKEKIQDPSYDGMSGRSESNIQAGVETARDILNADTEVDDEDKYLIILSDGAACMWYQDGEAYSKAYTANESNKLFWNSNEDWMERHERGKITPRSFGDVWNANVDLVSAYKMSVTEKDTVTDAKNDDRVASWDVVKSASDYYSTYEVATYYAAKSIMAARSEANVIMVTYPYHDDKTYGKYIESFKAWLNDQGISRYNYVTTEGNEAAMAASVFSKVKDELIQVVDSGSKVKDVIGKTAEYDFDFLNRTDRLKLTVDGEVLPVTAITEGLAAGETARYGFGDANGSKYGVTYPFVLHYYDETSDDADEYFIWDINVPVTKDKTVQLTYGVKLTNPKTEAGTYGEYDRFGTEGKTELYTNNSAVLYPVDSNQDHLNPEPFEKPTVSYEVKTDSPTPTPDPDTAIVHIQKVSKSTGKDLSGATLVLKDSDGNVISTFVTDGTIKTFDLEPGTYVLSETKAPSGYKTASDITFTVEAGETKTIVMEDPKKSSGGGGGGGGGSSSSTPSGGTTSGGPGTVTIVDEFVPTTRVEIEEAETPLGALPKTGQETGNMLMLLLSGMMMAAYAVITKKKERDN